MCCENEYFKYLLPFINKFLITTTISQYVAYIALYLILPLVDEYLIEITQIAKLHNKIINQQCMNVHVYTECSLKESL